MSETKPANCPFCGAEPYRHPEMDEDRLWCVACLCGATGPSARSEEDAVAKWNERLENGSAG